MAYFADFTNVFGIAFALNAFVSYIQDAERRSSQELAVTVTDSLEQFNIESSSPLNSAVTELQNDVRHKQRQLGIVAHTMSFLTLLSGTSALGILIYVGFNPHANASTSMMLLILGILLLLPLLTLGSVHFTSRLLKRDVAHSIRRLSPELEAAGFNRQGIIRIEEVAKLFAGIRITKIKAYSPTARLLAPLFRYWEKIRGRHTILFEGKEAKELDAKLTRLGQETGQSAEKIVMSALALTKVFVDNLDQYTAIRDKNGNELKRISNRDLLAAVRDGNPFESSTN